MSEAAIVLRWDTTSSALYVSRNTHYSQFIQSSWVLDAPIPYFNFFPRVLSDFWYFPGTHRLRSVFWFVCFFCWVGEVYVRSTGGIQQIFVIINTCYSCLSIQILVSMYLKRFTGNNYETQIYFCNLTLWSNIVERCLCIVKYIQYHE